MGVVEPVDVIDELMCFRAKADWLDVQICKPFILWVDYEIL